MPTWISSRKLLDLVIITTILVLLWLLFFTEPLPTKPPESRQKKNTAKNLTYPKSSAISDLISASNKNHSKLLQKLKKSIATMKTSSKTSNQLLKNVIPTISCPYVLQKIGRQGNKGKWVCGFEFLVNWTQSPRLCVIYAFSVVGNFSFESEILYRTPSRVLVFDLRVSISNIEITKATQAYPRRLNFTKVGLAAKTEFNRHWTLQTLGQLMLQTGHQWIDFLKIEIKKRREIEAFDQIIKQFEDPLPFHISMWKFI